MSETNTQVNPDRTGDEIAVIGMAGRFPGAVDVAEFWENLKNGVESLSFFTDDELKELDPSLTSNPNFVKSKGGVLENRNLFDASFFDYTPLEAQVMDPQMRIFHECAWTALEDAGYAPGAGDSAKRLIGLFAGAASSTNWQSLMYLSGKSKELGPFAANQLTDSEFLATRIAYMLDLKGPAVFVQSACSTGLVAVHLACQALLNGECNMALAGGVCISAEESKGYVYQEGMIYSPDGHCRAFDEQAKGTVGGNGIGIVVLKPLEDAEADGDFIHAVIKGSAINNDGIGKAAYSAPSRKGQSDVIRAAHALADVAPETITYVEAHGTGTTLGDPIEVEALKQAFDSPEKGFCALGSVKTNIGHLDAAAGVAGLIKTVLALKHKMIPPSLHYEKPNPKIDFADSPFYVNAKLSPWKSSDTPLRAGVSSFGIGGTNAHVVLEGTEPPSGKGTQPGYQLILLSAKTETAVDTMTQNLSRFLKENPHLNLADVAYTLQVGRRAFNHRRVAVCSTIDETVETLSSPDSGGVFGYTLQTPPGARAQQTVQGDERNVVFMFSGQGSQYVDMGLDLYRTDPVFRREMDRCFAILQPLVDQDLKQILYPESAGKGGKKPGAGPDINQTAVTQPLIFAFEYALAKRLIAWGIKPRAMIGHSIGEYTAACLSGVFSLEDALALVVLRGRLMQRMPSGSMLSVPLSEEELKPLLNPELSLAAVNAPSSCVVSGTHQAVDAFEKQLKEKGYNSRRLHTSHAFHSAMMDPVLETFTQKVRQITLNKPQIPYVSNVTGNWITVGDARDPAYWASQLRRGVRFSDGIRRLAQDKSAVFVEVGPGKALSTFARQYGEKEKEDASVENTGNEINVVNLVRHPKEDVPDHKYLLTKIGMLWLYGVKIDRPAFYPPEDQQRCRIPLPTYPFEGQAYRVRGDLFTLGAQMMSGKDLFTKKKNVADFFYAPLWKQSVLPDPANKTAETPEKTSFLVFTDDTCFGAALVKKLEANNHDVIVVSQGPRFEKIGPREYQINPRQDGRGPYLELIREISDSRAHRLPTSVVHLWNITRTRTTELDVQNFKEARNRGLYSLIHLVQAISEQNRTENIDITVVSDHLQDVLGTEPLCPEKSTLLAAVKVIPQEFPHIRCRSIDILPPEPGSPGEARLVDPLAADIISETRDTVIAYRNDRRWVRTFEPLDIKESPEGAATLKQGGVYLVTGGIGGMGLVLSRYLAQRAAARLILIDRAPLPPRDQWRQHLSTRNQQDPVTQKIRGVLEIEEMGAEVLVTHADVADLQQMRQVVKIAEERFGDVNGVIHAAGVTTGESVQCAVEQVSETHFEQQFQPKAYGLIVLDRIFRDKPLDFFIVTSSLSAILGGLGFAAYAAANIFMDAFIQHHNRHYAVPWTSVDWDGWQLGQLSGGEAVTALTPAEGTTAFQYILNRPRQSRFVVSTTDLQARIDRWIKLESLREDSQDGDAPEQAGKRKPRPNLTNLYVPPRTQIQQDAAAVWQDFFGFEKIGINDDFFELGGDSLKAINIVGKLHKKLDVEIPLPEFFKDPTIKGIAALAAETGEKKYIAVEAAEKKDYYVLSSAQKRLFLVRQLEPQSIAYNVSQAVLLEGRLFVPKVEETFKKLIEIHETFRTSFRVLGEDTVQVIRDHVEFEVELYEAERKDIAEVEEILTRFVRPFDLSRAPLLRVGLVKLEQEKYMLLADMHHIISDGISHVVLARDFMKLYSGETVPPPPLQYKDYSEWQHKLVDSGEIKKQEEYWLGRFTGDLPVLSLALDFPRPPVQSFEGRTIGFDLDEELTARINTLIAQQGVTLYMVLLAVTTILLSKYSGQDDIVVGTPIVGRKHPDLESIIGMFVNVLAMRNNPHGEKSFLEFLGEVKENALGAFDNQEYQFDDLVERLNVKRDSSRTPVYEVVFAVENIESPGMEIPGLTLKPHEVENRTSKTDLRFGAGEVDGKIRVMLTYAAALFKPETAEQMGRHYIEIAAQVAENTDVKLKDIRISHQLTEARANVLRDDDDEFNF
jgi:acyl transferase domain-containing protein